MSGHRCTWMGNGRCPWCAPGNDAALIAQGRREAIEEVVALLMEWASEVKNAPDYVEALRDAADAIEEKFK